ncbi:hypothetical protein GO621_12090 [Mucilaginibacter sp. HMF7410]|uniref:Uncharacterized protein n=1 Tax=Mucilaginibacter arboris TaxID=2682090 RepID=A0A7K1SXD5_9SPHI|nr:hypothetical protein [Mucilaginibacter arboris]MVN22273.1 hypothetical protein [Mucilaginibacter arboris]
MLLFLAKAAPCVSTNPRPLGRGNFKVCFYDNLCLPMLDCPVRTGRPGHVLIGRCHGLQAVDKG